LTGSGAVVNLANSYPHYQDSANVLTKTTVTAIRALVHIGLNRHGEPLSVRRIAAALGESPTYTAKVARRLARAGVLRVHRGVLGGIELGRPADTITLLEIVEACQGTILADFCQKTTTLAGTCAFHVASAELHQAIVGVLARWTVAQLVRRPTRSGLHRLSVPCLLSPQAGRHRRRPARERRPVTAAASGERSRHPAR
jgi:Rrf2 family protein